MNVEMNVIVKGFKEDGYIKYIGAFDDIHRDLNEIILTRNVLIEKRNIHSVLASFMAVKKTLEVKDD